MTAELDPCKRTETDSCFARWDRDRLRIDRLREQSLQWPADGAEELSWHCGNPMRQFP